MASVNAGDHEEAQFIHEPRLQEGAVDVAASLEEQCADSEMLAELDRRLSQVDGGLS